MAIKNAPRITPADIAVLADMAQDTFDRSFASGKMTQAEYDAETRRNDGYVRRAYRAYEQNSILANFPKMGG